MKLLKNYEIIKKVKIMKLLKKKKKKNYDIIEIMLWVPIFFRLEFSSHGSFLKCRYLKLVFI